MEKVNEMERKKKRVKLYIAIFLFWLLAILSFVYPQNKKEENAPKKEKGFIPAYRVSSIRDNEFRLNFIYFNKIISNNQEYLRVSFQLENMVNRDLPLKLIGIAYYETVELLDLQRELKYAIIKPYQRKIITFYDVFPKGKTGEDIVPLVDTHGVPVTVDKLVEPHGKPKLSVKLTPPYHPLNGANGYSFVLPRYDYQKRMGGTSDFIIYHLSIYRRNYYFFNNYALYIYDDTGQKLRFKVLYGLK
jgi:hypothetical protein